MLQFDIKHLSYFLETAQSGGMAKAAKRFGISQPAITQMTKTLESTLDEKLFVRSENGLELTPFGAAFADRADSFLGAIDQGVARVCAAARQEQGELRIATSSESVAQALCRSISMAGAASVTVQDASRDECVDRVKNHKADLAVIAGRASTEDYELLESEVVTAHDIYAYLPNHHSLARKKNSVTLEDLANLPLVLLDESAFPGHVDDIEQNFRRFDLPLRLAQLASSERTLLNYASSGIGAALAVGSFVPLGHPELKRLKVDGFAANVPRRIEILWRRDRLYPAAADFRRLFVTELNAAG